MGIRMNDISLLDNLPNYAKDLKLNYSKIKNEEILDKKQLYGCLFIGALTSNHKEFINFIREEVTGHLSEEEMHSVYAAYSIMNMNVIYYRFTHMAKGFDYSSMPANLRMHVMSNPGVDKLVFEMWCLSASIILGCEKCMNAHETELKSEGVTSIQIQTIARVSAIISAIGNVIKSQN
tara:strand:+ start:766 stop:1299 length:534 start_codon:yes stop_codon:yes gene_type:complete